MIIGLFILIGLFIYLIVTIVLVVIGVRGARKRGKAGWKGGVLVLVVMYLLLFWDWIPIHVAHDYYCATEGGFHQYKSLEEWKAENPGVAETLVPREHPSAQRSNEKTRYILNRRFAWDRYTSRRLLGIRERKELIVDTKTGEVLARYVDFDSGQHPRNPRGFRDFKVWLWTGSCEEGPEKSIERRFYEFKYLVKHQKEYR